ncbi:MAG: sugar transferase [Candidatus Magasanikbacteria bacterium]|nr:sugar transferase [Candidatus Magasanikbacteria bacterium]
MRRLDLAFAALLLPIDAIALFGAAISAYALRYSDAVTDIRPIFTDISLETYIGWSVVFVGVWMALFMLAGLYTIQPRRFWSTMGRVILASTAGIMVVVATVFFGQAFTTSRFILLTVWGLATAYVIIGRSLLHIVRRSLLRRGIGHRKLIVIGQSRSALDLITLYRQHPVNGFTVVKHLKKWTPGVESDYAKLLETKKADAVLLAEPNLDPESSQRIHAIAELYHADFRYLANPFASSFSRIEIDTAGGIPVIETKRTRLDGWGRIFKRLFDIFVALVLIILTSPVMILTVLALMIEDGLPVIYVSERVGERGSIFPFFKFRSMWRKFSIGSQFKQSTKANLALEKELIESQSIKKGPVPKIANDPRVTTVGRFIRRWSIDELPQFFNVLKGDLSLVGPRPHLPREVANYEPHHRRVLAIKPGITGLAQISGRSDLSFDDEVSLDTWYIEHWSPALDIYILLKTPLAVFKGSGTY